MTLTAGVALADALRAATGLPAAIKWPNDLVIGHRKVCGILAEGAAIGETLRHVILGFGVNVLASAYPDEIADRATSIEAELGRPVDRGAVFAESLACLAERLRQISAGGFDAVLDAPQPRRVIVYRFCSGEEHHICAFKRNPARPNRNQEFACP